MAADVISIDPDATYSKVALAAALGVDEKTVERQTKGKRPKLPRPFYIGRTPYWRGDVLRRWMDNEQAKALA